MYNIQLLIQAISPQIVSKHYQRVLLQWPVDALRPNVSFQETMRKRIAHRLEPSRVKPEENVVANEAQATVPTTPKVNEKSELEQVNVLYSFLDNRYTKKVCNDSNMTSARCLTSVDSIHCRDAS